MNPVLILLMVFTAIIVVVAVLPQRFFKTTKKSKIISTPTMNEERVHYCHAYLVREIDLATNEFGAIRLISRQDAEELNFLPCIAREVTIAFDEKTATMAICNPYRDRKSGKLDHFSRIRGREIAGGRLQKLQSKNVTEGEALIPRLQDFPSNEVRTSLNQYLQERRSELNKPKPKTQLSS